MSSLLFNNLLHQKRQDFVIGFTFCKAILTVLNYNFKLFANRIQSNVFYGFSYTGSPAFFWNTLTHFLKSDFSTSGIPFSTEDFERRKVIHWFPEPFNTQDPEQLNLILKLVCLEQMSSRSLFQPSFFYKSVVLFCFVFSLYSKCRTQFHWKREKEGNNHIPEDCVIMINLTS